MSVVFKAPLTSGFATSVGSFTPTFTRSTSAWYIDENGDLQSVSSGNGRFRTDLGFLSEPQITNLIPYSHDFSQWTASGSLTVTGSNEDGPRGASTMTLLSAEAANQTLIYDLGSVASYQGTFSIWIKRKTGTGNIELTRDGGSTWTDISSEINGDTPTRVRIIQTLADPDVGVRIVTSGDEVWVDLAQDEEHPDYTSNIVTDGSQVTRNADALSYDSTGLPTGGTFTELVLITVPADYPSGFGTKWVVGGNEDGVNGASLKIYWSAGRPFVEVYNSGSVANIGASSGVDDYAEGVQKAHCLTSENDDHRCYSSYTQRAQDTSGNTPTSWGADIKVGGYGPSYDVSHAQWTKNLAFDDSILSTSEMQAILEGETHEGVAALSGLGSLSVVASLELGAIASLSGAGSLSISGSFLHQAVASLSGSGSISASGALTLAGVAALAGLGDLTSVAAVVRSASASLSGLGDLAAVAAVVRSASASLTGQGNMTAVSSMTLSGVAALSGVGNLSVVGNIDGEEAFLNYVVQYRRRKRV